VILLLVAVLAVIGGARAYDWWNWQVNTPVENRREAVAIKVATGEGVPEIGDKLLAKRLIRDRNVFELYVRYAGARDKLQAGEFVLNRSMNMREIVEALQHSSVAQVSVTMPEGYTAKLMAQSVEKAGIGTSADYLAAVRDPSWEYDFLSSRPKGADLEGYLFPETYSLDRGAGVRDLVKLQLTQFGKEFSPELREQIARPAAGRPAESVQNIVILASMVEREVDRDPDRAMVCGVFYNRLGSNRTAGLLQVDATVLYAMGEWKRSLTQDELKFASPYNTYLHPGLPPGPIANPGAAAIRACVSPQKSDYFYYFTDPKGVTHFDRTLDEFENDKKRYGVSGA
jgi:UPF0755 protein